MSKLNKIIAISWTIEMFIIVEGEINGWYDKLMIIKYPVTVQVISSLIWYLGVMFLLYKFDINKILDKYL